MLSVKNLQKHFTTDDGQYVRAVDGLSFSVTSGHIFTLLGPSGCGKTTTMRSVVGLEKPTGGSIEVNGKWVYHSERGIFMPPNEREIGMVFQSYAIWPHMNVFENIAFPLHSRRGRRRMSKNEVQNKVMQVLKTVQMEGFENRQATKLSGGQQQRLALARALVNEPKLLLLDEPLSNLDAKLREHMRIELKKLQRELGITMVYVTHDQIEALALSDRVAVMKDGVIVQEGSPREIYEKPISQFVASFLGNSNFFSGKVASKDDRTLTVEIDVGIMVVDVDPSVSYHIGEKVNILVRPEDITLAFIPQTQSSSDSINTWQAKVETEIFLGDAVEFDLRFGQQLLKAKVHAAISLPGDQALQIHIPRNKCVVLKDEAIG